MPDFSASHTRVPHVCPVKTQNTTYVHLHVHTRLHMIHKTVNWSSCYIFCIYFNHTYRNHFSFEQIVLWRRSDGVLVHFTKIPPLSFKSLSSSVLAFQQVQGTQTNHGLQGRHTFTTPFTGLWEDTRNMQTARYMYPGSSQLENKPTSCWEAKVLTTYPWWSQILYV